VGDPTGGKGILRIQISDVPLIDVEGDYRGVTRRKLQYIHVKALAKVKL
jgi:hypothetical protein